MKFVRRWLLRRRIDRILRNAGWPKGLRSIFSGNIDVMETVYSPRTSLLMVTRDAAEFAEFYVTHYKDKRP